MNHLKKVTSWSGLEIGLIKIASMAFIVLVAKLIRQKYGWDMVGELDYWLLGGIIVVFGYGPAKKYWGKK
ncbi:hypothetical protein HQ544_02325 [Candidatus Falkowbacteria bacterium]|nr:hypothetical protein [Candidatus Falkowbacteria bacterium]